MKSKLLLSYTLDDEDRRGLELLQQLPEETFHEVINWHLAQESRKNVDRKVIRELAEKTNCAPKQLKDVIQFVHLMCGALNEEGNTSEAILEDFEELVPELYTSPELLRERFKLVEKVAERWSLFYKLNATEKRGAAHLKSASMSVVLKPVIERPYKPNEDLETYDPKILQYEPAVITEISLTDKSSFSFQISAENLKLFLNHLVSVQMELKAVSEDLGLGDQ